MLIKVLNFLFIFLFISYGLQAKEILFEGKYFESEDSLATHLYLSKEYKKLILITLEGIEQKKSCEFIEPFLETSIKAASELEDKKLVEQIFKVSQSCNNKNKGIVESYLDFLIQTKSYDDAYKLLEESGKNDLVFRTGEKKLIRASGKGIITQSLNMALIQNSNVNNGFTADTVVLFGMPFEVSDDANPRNELGVKLLHSSIFSKFLKEDLLLRLRTHLYLEDYPSSEFDRSTPFLMAELAVSNQDMFSFGIGENFWANNSVLSTISIAYSRNVLRNSLVDGVRVSVGKVNNSLNQTNSSDYLTIQAFFSAKKNWSFKSNYTHNKTKFGFSTYDELGLHLDKKYSLSKMQLKPFVRINKRYYQKEWVAYGLTRSYFQKSYGLSLVANSTSFLKNFRINLSRTVFNSNLPIYDNNMNIIEINYSLVPTP